MRVMVLAATLGGGILGCDAGTGALELTLKLPGQMELRPSGMTTITVTAQAAGESPISNTSVLSGTSFSAGELPVGRDVQVGIVLRDVSNRIVGVGDAGALVDIEGDRTTTVEIPVRRPFVYAASASGLYSFDPTLDPRDMRFQGMLAGVTDPLLTISVGGDRLAVVSSAQVQVVVTATNNVTGSITIPAGTRDAAAVPGSSKLAIAGTGGITIVDLDTGVATTAAVGPVDRVSVGPSTDGTLYAYGLVGRVVAPEAPPPIGTCTGSSSVVAVAIDAPSTVAPRSLPSAVSDLTAAPDAPGVFVTLPCEGEVARIDGDLVGEVAQLTLATIASLERASVLTIAGDRIWAAGTRPSVPVCDGGACTAATEIACPATASSSLAFVTDGASLIVTSMALDGGDPIVLAAPGRRETIIDVDDTARQHAQVLKALGVTPLDLVALPGGQYVALVTSSRSFISTLSSPTLDLLPCLDARTTDWQLFDLASSSIPQRVRTSCEVAVGTSDIFQTWACEDPPIGEQSRFPDYQPRSIGALFGAR